MNNERRGGNEFVTGKQLTAIHLLATGFSQRNVCRIIGISPVTLNKWWGEPSFRAEYHRATGSDARHVWRAAADGA